MSDDNISHVYLSTEQRPPRIIEQGKADAKNQRMLNGITILLCEFLGFNNENDCVSERCRGRKEHGQKDYKKLTEKENTAKREDGERKKYKNVLIHQSLHSFSSIDKD